MSSKHLYNNAEGLVSKSLRGATYLNPALRFHAPSKTIYTHPHSRNPNTSVAVISGGGAGHEPAHAGYTGRGMLTASVSGDIFASPSAKSIGTTIQLAAHEEKETAKKDVLAIINNYTGDRLNFGLAIEKARASGINVESVVVADDVSLLRSDTSSVVGPRGLAGNILVCKILGAAAERGMSLKDIKELGDAVVGNLRSVGVGLDHCHVPGRAKPGAGKGDETRMTEDEMEVGLGLHNEPGVERKLIGTPEDLLIEMIDKVLFPLGHDSETRGFVGEGDDSVLFVNNLGGMSQLEMGGVVKDVVDLLGMHPPSSRDLAQASHEILCRSISAEVDPIALISDPTDAVAWIGSTDTGHYNKGADITLIPSDSPSTDLSSSAPVDWKTLDISASRVEAAITTACNAVLEAEKDLTYFDTIVGDGDCGETFVRGARAILDLVENLDISRTCPSELVRRIENVLEDNMGGTIGALFAIFFTAWSSALASPHALSRTPQTALQSLRHHTPAKPGDRTIIDALEPFCMSLANEEGLEQAMRKAKNGADSTRGMKAKLGRAVYVGDGGKTTDSLPPDPGAWGMVVIVEGFFQGYYKVNP
ncbi:hypothetical protein PQX77_011508 [Marasmius sp. AFHP31]|nr:hypothetical protein PQX77_011508 [Marasmius sp. AFHP31]